IDIVKLRKEIIIVTKLSAFVRQVTKNILIAQENEEDTQVVIKKCDKHTIDLKILEY
ncbi:963_t:CDS:1, partial [Funneliformis caledonium]